MKKQWILVANGSLARIFSRTSAGDPLRALEAIDFPEGRLKAAELQRDRQGHESSDNSSAAAHFEPRTSAHQKVRHQFARELAERLEEGLVDSEYETLWLIASSPFLGDVKAALSKPVSHRLQWVHEADFTSLDVGTLEHRLRELHKPAR